MTYITQTTTNQNYSTSLKMQISDMERDYLFLQNELTDTLRPSIGIIDFTYVIAELLEKNVEYVKRAGMTAPAKESRDKLLYLMNIGETFNKLSADNQKLKLYNRTILAENKLLIKELKEIKRQEMLAKSI
jgi:hypothetical protein